MNPAIVIPTYWTDRAHAQVAYDHSSLVEDDHCELERCLDSLEQARGVIRTILLLVAPPEAEAAARLRVDALVEAHPRLSPVVIGTSEAARLRDEVFELAPTLPGEGLALRGYGAIRNIGLAATAVFGHDVAVFLDDDEMVLDDTFLLDAVYALGQLTRQGEPVVAKSGFFLNKDDSAYASEGLAWYDRDWDKHADFNQWMRKALSSTRISRSNHVCGGCMALHAEAFTRVAFDPYITRGEDLDYLINLRFYGLDVWFDNRWRVKHLPPSTTAPAKRFAQNVYRWVYERAKLQFAASIIGFNRVTASSLMPYPGQWMDASIDDRARKTAFRRSIGTSEHKAYFEIWRHGVEDARANAERTKQCYLAFQTWWPSLMRQLWNRKDLALALLATGTPKKLRELVKPEDTAVILTEEELDSASSAKSFPEAFQEEAVETRIALKDADELLARAVDSAIEAAAASTPDPNSDSEGAAVSDPVFAKVLESEAASNLEFSSEFEDATENEDLAKTEDLSKAKASFDAEGEGDFDVESEDGLEAVSDGDAVDAVDDDVVEDAKGISLDTRGTAIADALTQQSISADVDTGVSARAPASDNDQNEGGA